MGTMWLLLQIGGPFKYVIRAPLPFFGVYLGAPDWKLLYELRSISRILPGRAMSLRGPFVDSHVSVGPNLKS